MVRPLLCLAVCLATLAHAVQPPSIVLRYFDIRGRMEPIRLSLVYLNLGEAYWERFYEWCPRAEVAHHHGKPDEFEPCTGREIDWTWEANRTSGAHDAKLFTFGQVPHMVWVGQDTAKRFDIVDTAAILRFIAKQNMQKWFFYGDCENGTKQWEVDEVYGGTQDLYERYHALVHDPKVLEDPSILEKYKAEVVPTWFGYFEKILDRTSPRRRNMHNHKWLGGSKATFADVSMFNLIDIHRRLFGAAIMDDFPLLSALYKNFGSKKRIHRYIKSEKRRHWVNGRKAFMDSKKYPLPGDRHPEEGHHAEL